MMKLRKNATTWCWVNFKYEGIPAFCFICGMVGHSDKFCAKLFDTPLDKIEKPYGIWMRADPRRRSHTIDSKWLRMGGATQASDTVIDNSGNSVTEIGANVITVGEKSGITTVGDRTDNVGKKGENQGALSVIDSSNTKLSTINSELKFQKLFTTAEVENVEILVADPKRRKMENTFGPNEESNFEEDTCMSPQEDVDQNQKNLILAGAAQQARHSS
ncbi:hypothetical protein POM88_005887 [Heracleum sosnowskyi]|uniref:Zinc knuckle CX2CX4HX4C domain-containing protein n=1 Tax=Heracleum sosnowskyi TaxID=360622 RepID=A0AAD8J1M7_9APIA|nr:hypothetical protein POM88_005887 [Heracleum sosnowskyi]